MWFSGFAQAYYLLENTSAASSELYSFSHFIPQLAPLGLRNGLYLCRSFGSGNLSFGVFRVTFLI